MLHYIALKNNKTAKVLISSCDWAEMLGYMFARLDIKYIYEQPREVQRGISRQIKIYCAHTPH